MATIKERRDWARKAVEVFRAETGTEKRDAIGDLVCDLMHLATEYRQDPLHEVKRGIQHHYAETHKEALCLVEIYLIPLKP